MVSKSDLQSALTKANEVVSAIEAEVRQAEIDAARLARQKFTAQLNDARSQRVEAEKALREFIEANSSHPWEGKKVKRTERKAVSRWNHKFEDVEVFGVVEVRRSGTILPENQSWGLPRTGDAFVRLLLKNGEPGKKIDRHHPDAKHFYGERKGENVWVLAE